MTSRKKTLRAKSGERPVPPVVRRQLAWYFRRNGCVRRQDRHRLAREGYLGYKKGDEVRLTANNTLELRRLKALLQRAGFTPGRPYAKGRQYRLPLYGRDTVRRFLQCVRLTARQARSAASKRSPHVSARAKSRRLSARR